MANMKKLFITVMVIGLTFTTITAFAQSAKEAIMALKKLEARCQTGISYRDYSSALGEAKFPVNVFQESKEASKNIKLAESISRAMGHYETAGKFWGYKFSVWKYYINSDELEILEKYPDATKDVESGGARMTFTSVKGPRMVVDFLLPIVWREASKELTNTSKLYAELEENGSSDLDKIKKENADLKKQLELLKSKNKK